MNKILVVGGAGYIGSHTVHMLTRRGYEVHVYDSLENGHIKSLPKNAHISIGSTADKEKLHTVLGAFRPDAVMHFAGYTEVGESQIFPEKYYTNNLINGINLVKTMMDHGINNIVYSSTAAVYGQPKSMPITEDMETEPTNHYGWSKLLFERYLDSVDGLNSICLRYFNAAGAGYGIGEDHDPETHLIPLVLQTLLGQRDRVRVFGGNYDTRDGTCVRDYVHVMDLAEAHIYALYASKKKSDKYNLGTGRGHSVWEVLCKAKDITGKEVPYEFVEPRKGDPAKLVASYNKIRDELGWKPKRGLKQIIESAWKWHLRHPNGFSNGAQTRHS